MAITLIEDLPEVRLGSFGPLFVTVWYAELTSRSVDALERQQKSLVAQYGQITLLSVVVSASKQVRPELRDRIKEHAKELGRQRLGNIVAVTNSGLGAIIARTFLAALSLVNEEQMVIVKTLAEAAEAARKLPGQSAEVVEHVGLAADLEAFVKRDSPVA